MAADTVGGQSLPVELAHCANLVTGIAIRDRMRADQGEAILVLVDGMYRHLPTVHLVAHVALRSVATAMNVRMAVLALSSNIRK